MQQRSLPAKAATVVKGLSAWLKSGCARRILTIYGGLGDELLLSAALRELSRRSLKPPTLAVTVPELFENSPDVGRMMRGTPEFLRMAALLPVTLISPKYPIIRPEGGVPEHFITTICRSLELKGGIDLLPYFYLRSEELNDADFAQGHVCIQSSSAAARWPILNKEWGAGRYQELVYLLRGRIRFLQLGSHSDPRLEGAEDLRGRTTLRQTAAILHASNGVVCNEGFLMHLARAVDRRAVVIYGGRILVSHSGYSANINLSTCLPCSPCGQDVECAFDRHCLTTISVESVAEKILEMEAARDVPLAVDQAVID